MPWLNQIKWNVDGLIPVITQEFDSNQVLNLAWMSKESLTLSVKKGYVIYWSRSRKKLWNKGEQSGHKQLIKHINLDCDDDTLLIKVEQIGGIACHTGRHHCFYQKLQNNKWITTYGVLKDPKEIYV
ncbi:MAG: phosphoribosyl-AMP cyclohydrolase [Piscirickettsiaceae bacterium]|nr:phosphoribosyl-AMP cyclohydrolase [Piscirickettsiaceae bacterium]